MSKQVKQAEDNIMYNLNYCYCGGDISDYVKICSDRFDAIVQMLDESLIYIKDSQFIRKVSKSLVDCNSMLEKITSKLVKFDLNNTQEEMDINITKPVAHINKDDIPLYEKILEFTVLKRLNSVKIKNLFLDNINLETNKNKKTNMIANFTLNPKLEYVKAKTKTI